MSDIERDTALLAPAPDRINPLMKASAVRVMGREQPVIREPRPSTAHVTLVASNWNRTFGCLDGFRLMKSDRQWITFPGEQPAIAAALGAPFVNQHDQPRDVNWLVSWGNVIDLKSRKPIPTALKVSPSQEIIVNHRPPVATKSEPHYVNVDGTEPADESTAPLPPAHHAEAPVIAFTEVMVNEHLIHVTAREGATPESVAATINALLGGLRIAYEQARSYGVVSDGRDSVAMLKGEAPAVQRQALRSADKPADCQPIAPAPNGADKGTSPCLMIRVAQSYGGGKPQLEFECDGFEMPLRYTKDNPAHLAQLLTGIKQTNGAAFTAADMAAGRKFGGNWLVDWAKATKGDKTYTNVVAVRPGQ